MSERRLSPADAMWLYSEWDRNPQTVSALLWLDREIDPNRLRQIIQVRMVDKYPVFHQRIRRSRNPLFMPLWTDDTEFSLDNHFEVVQLPEPGDKATLEALVSEQRSQLLDHSKPLWKIFLIQGYQNNGTATSAIHARVQHCIADGWALVRLVLSLADETSAARPPKVVDRPRARRRDLARKATAPISRTVGSVRSLARFGQSDDDDTGFPAIDPRRFLEFSTSVPIELARQWGRAASVAETVAQVNADAVDFVLAPRPGKTILHGDVSGQKKVTWMEPMPLAPIKQAGRPLGATINDVLLGCLTDALRRYLQEKDALNVTELFTAMPISLRRPDAPLPRNLGNRFGLIPVLLPVGIEDPVEQVRSIKAQIDEIKQSQLPIVSFGLMSASALVTPEVERLIHRINQDHSIGVTTNVPGPRAPIDVAGGRVLGAWGMGGLSGQMNLSFGIFSLAGELNFSVHSDTAITSDPERIRDLFEESARRIVELTGAGGA